MKPVVKLAAGDTIQAIISAASAKVPSRPMGIRDVMYSTCAGGMRSTSGVWMTAVRAR